MHGFQPISRGFPVRTLPRPIYGRLRTRSGSGRQKLPGLLSGQPAEFQGTGQRGIKKEGYRDDAFFRAACVLQSELGPPIGEKFIEYFDHLPDGFRQPDGRR